MSISSAMTAGVSGLNVNASKLATISDNISNAATFGYKRAEADFAALARTESSGRFSAGGVVSSTFRQVEQKGTLIRTTNETDISVNGRGMLPVTPVSALRGIGEMPLQLVSTGSFQPDATGVLRTTSGLALLGWPAAADGTVPPQPRDSAVGLEPVVVQANQLAAEATRNVSFGANLPAAATLAGGTATALPISIEYFGNLGTSETLTASFTPDVSGPGYSNTWRLELSDSATTVGTNPIAVFDIVFDDSPTAAGSIQSVTRVSSETGTDDYDPSTGVITLTVGDGAGSGGGELDILIGRPLAASQLTQFSADFAPTAIQKDGAPVGNLATVEIDENGQLFAIYDTGFTRLMYQVPLVDVPNLNGLRALDNQAFALSSTSGSMYLWDAGDGPTGSTVGFSREQSTTDIAGELTALIETQRAYSSNAKIIQTVDEMLQETTNIKR